MIWHTNPGNDIQAPLSYTAEGPDHYVISHRNGEHCVSWRPPGEHVSIGEWPTAEEARDAAERHARGEPVQPPYNPWNRPPHVREPSDA